jgi:hypothetical protein
MKSAALRIGAALHVLAACAHEPAPPQGTATAATIAAGASTASAPHTPPTPPAPSNQCLLDLATTPIASRWILVDGCTASGTTDLDGDHTPDCWSVAYTGGHGAGTAELALRSACGTRATRAAWTWGDGTNVLVVDDPALVPHAIPWLFDQPAHELAQASLAARWLVDSIVPDRGEFTVGALRFTALGPQPLRWQPGLPPKVEREAVIVRSQDGAPAVPPPGADFERAPAPGAAYVFAVPAAAGYAYHLRCNTFDVRSTDTTAAIVDTGTRRWRWIYVGNDHHLIEQLGCINDLVLISFAADADGPGRLLIVDPWRGLSATGRHGDWRFDRDKLTSPPGVPPSAVRFADLAAALRRHAAP